MDGHGPNGSAISSDLQQQATQSRRTKAKKKKKKKKKESGHDKCYLTSRSSHLGNTSFSLIGEYGFSSGHFIFISTVATTLSFYTGSTLLLSAANTQIAIRRNESHKVNRLANRAISMAWHCSGSSNTELVENLFKAGLIKNERVKDAMLRVSIIFQFILPSLQLYYAPKESHASYIPVATPVSGGPCNS